MIVISACILALVVVLTIGLAVTLWDGAKWETSGALKIACYTLPVILVLFSAVPSAFAMVDAVNGFGVDLRIRAEVFVGIALVLWRAKVWHVGR